MTTDLESIVGAMVTAVTRARRIADEETVATAEHYRQHPLLSGMSVPRVRLPEVTLDVPVVVEDYHAGTVGEPASPAAVSAAARDAVKAFAAEEGVKLPSGVLSGFRDRFAAVAPEPPPAVEARTRYGDLAESVLAEVVAPAGLTRLLDEPGWERLRTRVRQAVEERAVIAAPDPARLRVSVLTKDVKDAAPDTVARMHFRMLEEGVEWTVVPQDDGSTTHRLLPE